MRINFTYNKNEYTLCSTLDLAKILAEYIENTKKPGQTKFVADIALSEIDYESEIDLSNPEDIVLKTEGWHGVKELGEIGFNAYEDRHLIFDYYGGGHMIAYDTQMDYDIPTSERVREILDIIEDLLDVANDDWLVLVQWTQDECLVRDEKEAVKPIEDAAVTNFAEMLCDYVSGLDEGEGIGREDIIDHLYEYINWDNRFTREYEEGKKNFKPF